MIKKPIDWPKMIFTLSGAKLYMDWLLITNWSSKNRLIRRIWRGHPGMVSVDNRLKLCGIYGWLHLPVSFIALYGLMEHWNVWGFWLNMLGNWYPCVIQLYVGYRCVRVKRERYRNKMLLNII